MSSHAHELISDRTSARSSIIPSLHVKHVNERARNEAEGKYKIHLVLQLLIPSGLEKNNIILLQTFIILPYIIYIPSKTSNFALLAPNFLNSAELLRYFQGICLVVKYK